MQEEQKNEEAVQKGSSGLDNIVAKNEEAMIVAENNHDEKGESGEKGEEGCNFIPSFFIEEDDRHRIEVDLLFDKKTGRVLSVSKAGLVDLNSFNYLHQTKEWFDFSIPAYDDITKYRQRSTVTRDGETAVDAIQLRNFLLVWCLKDWSLIDKTGKKQELTFNDSGALSDASISKVYSVPNSIIDVVLSIFEKDVLLTD